MGKMDHAAGQTDDELLTRLPPLEHADDDEVEGPRDGYGSELAELSALDGDDDDSEDAEELDVGFDLSSLEHDSSSEAVADLGMDVGDLLMRIEDGQPGDDRVGLPGLDISEGVREAEFDGMAAAAGEGLGEPLEDLVDEELPGLDADAEGDFEEGDFGHLEVVDDARPTALAGVWHVEQVETGEQSQVAAVGMGVAALGAKLAFHRPGFAPRSVPLPARATTLTTLDDSVLVATVTGKLFRARPDGHLEALSAFERDAPRALSSMPYGVQAGGNADGIALLLDTGEVVVSADAGDTFLRLETDRPLHALSACGSVACDSDDLLFVETGLRLPLPPEVQRSRSAGHVLVARRADTLLVAVPEIGVMHSKDGGQSFDRIVGTQGACALALEDRRLWVGVFGTAFQDAAVLQVDLSTGAAHTACTLAGSTGQSIAGIARAEQDGSLWLASSLGLFVARPPAS
jgi:hypothetical protein